MLPDRLDGVRVGDRTSIAPPSLINRNVCLLADCENPIACSA
jgi:hypothetical protein